MRAPEGVAVLARGPARAVGEAQHRIVVHALQHPGALGRVAVIEQQHLDARPQQERQPVGPGRQAELVAGGAEQARQRRGLLAGPPADLGLGEGGARERGLARLASLDDRQQPGAALHRAQERAQPLRLVADARRIARLRCAGIAPLDPLHRLVADLLRLDIQRAAGDRARQRRRREGAGHCEARCDGEAMERNRDSAAKAWAHAFCVLPAARRAQTWRGGGSLRRPGHVSALSATAYDGRMPFHHGPPGRRADERSPLARTDPRPALRRARALCLGARRSA